MNISRRNTLWILALTFIAVVMMRWLLSPPVRFLLFPPNDLYAPLTKGPIDVGKEKSSYSFSFVNKYKGNHNIGVAVEKLPEGHYHAYKMDFEAEITIFQNGKAIMSKSITKPISAYWGGYNKIGGFILLYYGVPDELPLSKPLVCTVKITKGNTTFKEVYGNPEFYIGKSSDK